MIARNVIVEIEGLEQAESRHRDLPPPFRLRERLESPADVGGEESEAYSGPSNSFNLGGDGE